MYFIVQKVLDDVLTSVLEHLTHTLPDKLLPGSVDEQLVKDVHLVGSIPKKHAQIFTEECKPFPEDVQIQSIYPL